MQNYVNVVFNHFRAIQSWAQGTNASVLLDIKTFEIEAKHRGRYYSLYPMFQARTGEQSSHTTQLTSNSIGFGGWRPYKAVQHPHSTDKRLFKEYAVEAGLHTPHALQSFAAGEAPSFDYIVKAASGSFGKEIEGPYCAGRAIASVPADLSQRPVFAEQFVQGTILKVWFWGRTPVFAHAHSYPQIVGDGDRSVIRLLREKLRRVGQDWDHFADRKLVLACLEFQGTTDLDEVLPAGTSRWIDYRYQQRYEPNRGVTPTSDSALEDLISKSGDQVARMGEAIAALISRTIRLPLLISVDGMLDADGKIWWVEMNTNSIMPPDAYPVMLSELFA